MARKRTREGQQSDALERMGLGHNVPIPEFSDQPDSGGRIGGVRGVQEFGIEGDDLLEDGHNNRGLISDVQATSDEVLQGTQDVDEALLDIEDELDDLMADQSEDEDEDDDAIEVAAAFVPRIVSRSDHATELRELVADRLQRNPSLHLESLRVSVIALGLVTVAGKVQSEAEKLRATEIVSSLPGVVGIRNILKVVGRGT